MSGAAKKANGEGTVFQRPNGRWSGQCYVTQTDGRRVRRTVTGATKREVEKKISELIERESSGRRIAPADLTVESYLQEWLGQVVIHRVRANTLAAYRFQAERYLIPDLGRKRLSALSARDLRLYFESMRRRDVGARTIGYVHATLRAALEDAVREELLDRNVAKLVRVPRPEKVEREPLSVDEVKTLLRHSRDDRLIALIIVLALLGLRRSEALGLMWTDVDLDAGWLQVRRGLQRINGQLISMPTKTARSRRTIPLPDVIVEALLSHRQRQAKERVELAEKWPDLGYVFTTPIGTPIDPRNCTRIVQNACRDAGVRIVRLHDFRHGCVSVLLALGVPPRTAMDIAGHSTIEMTMNVYGHVTLDEKREALDRLGGLFEEEK
ncbi:integrase [Nocardioides ginsengisegetis]|uniref:Integrase n=1 Tax=Nocardioides ginsengisegetis TaxID=661491 RepID=A0A7W3J3A7_9ACTN|nr:site-specific integrase [Nocardioides ginsengisegetis]MBA8805493.1 integrase [Nocardioides ginsengisegetis]